MVNNNNNDDNKGNDGIIELNVAAAFANMDVSIEEDIDIDDLTREYSQSHDSIPAFLSLSFPHRIRDTQIVATIPGKPNKNKQSFTSKQKSSRLI
jgi:hypothetical protein